MEGIKQFLALAPKRVRDRGASLVEYALLVALIAVVCIGAVTQLGNAASGETGAAGAALAGEADDGCPAGEHRGLEAHGGEFDDICYSNTAFFDERTGHHEPMRFVEE